MWVWKESLQSNQTPRYLQLFTYSKSEPSRVVMLDRRAGAGCDWLKSMHLVLLVFKSSWRPRKESCMALKLAWRVVNTVFKEGPEVYRMVSSAQGWFRGSPAVRATSLMYTEKRVGSKSVRGRHEIINVSTAVTVNPLNSVNSSGISAIQTPTQAQLLHSDNTDQRSLGMKLNPEF